MVGVDPASALDSLHEIPRHVLAGARLEEHGFCLLHLDDVTEEEVEAVKNTNCFNTIANAEDETGLTGGDGTRTQSNPNLNKVVKGLRDRMLKCMTERGLLETSRTVPDCRKGATCVSSKETSIKKSCCKRGRNTRVLRSVPKPCGGRGEDQPPHCDAASALEYHGNDFDPKDVPLSVVLAVQEDTFLAIRMLGETTFRLVRYGRGDMLVFRGDVCHYGVGYDRENTRLHIYVDSFLGRQAGQLHMC